MKINYLPVILLLLFALSVPAGAGDQKKQPSAARIALGVGVVAGGSIFSIYNYTRAKAFYNQYEKSAFTDNTIRLHRETKLHDILCIAGAAVAGLGAVIVVVSF